MSSLEKYKFNVYSCVRCGMCRGKYTEEVRYVCPVREHTGGFEHYFARGRIAVARGILEGELDYSDALAEVVYTCTTCGNCRVQCGALDAEGKPLIEADRITEAMRADIVKDHPEMVRKAHKTIMDSIKTYENPYMKPRIAKAKWARGLDIKNILKDSAKVLLYTGCTTPIDPELKSVITATAKVLKKGNVDFGILGEKERCCGSVLRRIGAVDLFEKLAGANIKQFNELGIDVLVTSCAGCFRTIKKEYPEIGDLNFEVLHISEYMDRLIKENKESTP